MAKKHPMVVVLEKEWGMTLDDVLEAMRSRTTDDSHIDFLKEYIETVSFPWEPKMLQEADKENN